MENIMSRQELLELYTKMLRQAEADYDGFTDEESRRKFMNSISAIGTQFDTLLFRTRQDEIERRLKALEDADKK